MRANPLSKIKLLNDSLNSELFQFLDRVRNIYLRHEFDFQFDSLQLFDTIVKLIQPQEDQPINNDTLSNFLQSTLKNQSEKKLKKIYYRKQLTQISASTKLFGSFSSQNLTQSISKQAKPNHGTSSFPEIKQQVDKQDYNFAFPFHGYESKEIKMEGQEKYMSSLCQSSQDDKNRSNNTNRRLYKLYPVEIKIQIIEYASKFGFKAASDRYKISTPKIQFWSKSLCRIKQARGRKPIDPNMEEKVCLWLKRQLDRGTMLTQRVIREKAKKISCSDDFKASKGWLQKFFRRRPQLFEAYSNNRRSYQDIQAKQQESIYHQNENKEEENVNEGIK